MTPSTRPARLILPRVILVVAVLGASTHVVGCGDEAPGPESADPRPGRASRPLPELPAIPLADRAAYALQRLMRGPLPPRGLRIPHLHRRNLEIATDDLVALAPHAWKQLGDPELVERVVGGARRNADPWHNILFVLLALPDKRAETVLAWTEPVLTHEPRAPASPLRLAAVRVLAVVDDPRTAPLLLDFFEAAADQRELASMAFPTLLARASPWMEQAMEAAHLSGCPSVWEQVPRAMAASTRPGAVDRSKADCLAWWTALSEGSGPPPPLTRPRMKHHAWAAARLWMDSAVARAETRAGGRTGQVGAYGPPPAVVSHGGGWIATRQHDQAVFPSLGLAYDGKQYAAAARCLLASWGYAPYRSAVRKDLESEAAEPRDARLYFAGIHCLQDPDSRSAREQAKQELGRLLATDAPPSMAHALRLGRLVSALGSAQDPEVWALLEKVLRTIRPLDVHRGPLETAHDALGVHPGARRALVLDFLRRGEADRETVGVALHLIRRSADVAYVPALEAMLEAETDDARASTIQRVLLYIYGRAKGLVPSEQQRIVDRLVGRMASAPERVARAMASVLLDLGEPGAHAFASGLRGTSRSRFLAAWPRGRLVVPRHVAEAAIEPMGRETARSEMQDVLSLAYQGFPDTAAPALEALRQRAAPAHKPWVQVVLDRVRHRAPLR